MEIMKNLKMLKLDNKTEQI